MSSIDTLTQASSHIEFLNILNESSMLFRVMETQMIAEYGKDSDAHHRLKASILRQDSLNLIMARYYLEKHNYPDPAAYGQQETDALFSVLNASHKPRDRRDFYIAIYDAYQLGFISDKQYVEFLQKSYMLFYGKSLDCQGCTDSNRITALEKFFREYHD